jgi:hypothetical protein
MMIGFVTFNSCDWGKKSKGSREAEDSHLLMQGCVDGHALATIWQDGNVLLFKVRHSSKGLQYVGPVTLQHFWLYTPNNTKSHPRRIGFLAM